MSPFSDRNGSSVVAGLGPGVFAGLSGTGPTVGGTSHESSGQPQCGQNSALGEMSLPQASSRHLTSAMPHLPFAEGTSSPAGPLGELHVTNGLPAAPVECSGWVGPG